MSLKTETLVLVIPSLSSALSTTIPMSLIAVEKKPFRVVVRLKCFVVSFVSTVNVKFILESPTVRTPLYLNQARLLEQNFKPGICSPGSRLCVQALRRRVTFNFYLKKHKIFSESCSSFVLKILILCASQL